MRNGFFVKVVDKSTNFGYTNYVMENVFGTFTASILKINRLIQKIKTCEMSGYGLKTVHATCLYYLSQNQSLTLGELIKLTFEDKAAVSRAVKLLKEKNVVSYDADGYNSPVTLTEEGKRLAAAVTAKAEKAVCAASCDFSDGERNGFYNSLSSIEAKLEKYYEEISKGEIND